MSLDVDNAILNRWVAAGLDSSIAVLYPGDETAAPEATDMPRAEYFSTGDVLEVESRGTLTLMKTYTFNVWGTNYETVAGYVKSVIAAMLNSENAGTGPLNMATDTGEIRGTHWVDEGTDKQDDGVFRGFFQMLVRWTKAKTNPS